ncbi:MAG: hypothetical protein ABI772_01950 [Bacteroidota bacterium]
MQSEDEMVAIAFSINSDCTIEVQQVNTSNPVFLNHVIEQLSKIDLRNVQHESGKTYCYKFSFHTEK